MKEYYSELGGRHLYSSDIKNLQELASAFAQLFKGANVNFVLSGCVGTYASENAATGNFSEGYVYLDGRICHVDAAENVSGNNLKIVLKQRNGGNIPYADGTYHPQYVEYYGEYSNDVTTDAAYIAAYRYNSHYQFPNIKLFLKDLAILHTFEGVNGNGSDNTQDIYTPLNVHSDFNAQSLASEQNMSLYNGKYKIEVTDSGVSFIWSDGLSFKLDSSNVLYFKYKESDAWTEFGSIIPTNGIIPYLKNLQVDSLYVKDLLVNGGTVPGTIPLGGIISYAGRVDMIPSAYCLCDGRQVDCMTIDEKGNAIENSNMSPIFNVLGGVENEQHSLVNGVDTITSHTKYIVMPDLRGRFIVGYDPNTADYSTIGKKGGEKTHKLTSAEMPQHKHSYEQNDLALAGTVNYQDIYGVELKTTPDSGGTGSGRKGGDSPTNSLVAAETLSSWITPATKTELTDETGAGQPHENRPPYYTLAYIMRII